jgi:hypothetical protein
VEISPIDQDVYATRDAITTHGNRSVHFTDTTLKAITRLRFLGDSSYGWADPSYATGTLADGTPVHVTGWDSLPYRRRVGQRWFKSPMAAFRFYLCEYGKKNGVNLARLGAFDNLSFMD